MVDCLKLFLCGLEAVSHQEQIIFYRLCLGLFFFCCDMRVYLEGICQFLVRKHLDFVMLDVALFLCGVHKFACIESYLSRACN